MRNIMGELERRVEEDIEAQDPFYYEYPCSEFLQLIKEVKEDLKEAIGKSYLKKTNPEMIKELYDEYEKGYDTAQGALYRISLVYWKWFGVDKD